MKKTVSNLDNTKAKNNWASNLRKYTDEGSMERGKSPKHKKKPSLPDFGTKKRVSKSPTPKNVSVTPRSSANFIASKRPKLKPDLPKF